MADEELLDLDLDQGEVPNRTEKRIKDLSEKVKTTATERDDFAKGKADEESKRIAVEKERDFFKNFNTVSSKYQGAADYQDKILEKVKSGYDVEDATISILAKEGKYQPQAAPPPPKESPAGGSATTTLKSGEKSLEEMTREEKKAAVQDSLNKGEISFRNL